MATSAVSIRRYFGRLKDPRVRGRCRHRLLDIIAMALCGVICGCKDWQQVVAWAEKRQDWLQTFLALPEGIPSHDTFERVFELVQPEAFHACFQQWIAALAAGLKIRHIAVDGKTLRGSGNAARGWKPLHVVSAWATAHHLSLGEVAVTEKSNEITAIPRLLALLDISGALVTIDAMGCQKEIAQQIVAHKGDYVLTVKENQPNLFEAIHTRFVAAAECDYRGYDYDEYETQERGHGRCEKRWYSILTDPQDFAVGDDWPKLRVIGMCYSERTVAGKTSEEVRYFIGSRKASARTYGQALRNHWSIENSLHWQLDVTFGEDDNRVAQRNSAENLAALRRLAVTLLKRHPGKRSIACKQVQAMVSTEFLEEVLAGDVKLLNL
jgi:predicted transposase YbfD/YdcC